MKQNERQLSDLLNRFRWLIPMLMAGSAIGYIIFDHFLLAAIPLTSTQIIREIIIIGTVGPSLVWFLLTWVVKIDQSRRETRKILKRRALQLEAASQVGQKVTAILDVDELLPHVVTLIQSKFGYHHVHLFLVDGHTNEIVLRANTGEVGQILKAQGLRFKIGEQSITGRVAQTGQPILCNNVAEEPGYCPHELLPNTRSELSIPLKIGDIIVGVLDVQSKQLDAFQEDDLTTLQILGDQIAVAIENANLFQETQHRFLIRRALHDIALEITSHLDSDRVLKVILNRSIQLLKAQDSSIAVHNPETNLIHMLAHSKAKYQSVVFQIGEGVAGRVIATGKPLMINDLEHWKDRLPVYKDSPYNAILSVPLFWQGKVFGALNVTNKKGARSFNEDDVKLMSLFADLASIALKNSELFTQVTHLSQNLEQKVEQRTIELVKVQKELAQKAAQLQQVFGQMVRVQEEERSRIALDLHDGSNQLITGALFEIQATQQSIQNQRQARAMEMLETAKRLLRQIEAENRRIISGLRPPILDAKGLVSAVRWQATTCQQHYGLICSVKVSGQAVRLSSDAEIVVYRVVQESLNNIVIHAQAETVQICLAFNSTSLQITILDDGIGFDKESVIVAVSDQVGLIGMRERIQSIGGRIKINSMPGHGTHITLDVPLVTELVPQAVSVLEGPNRTLYSKEE